MNKKNSMIAIMAIILTVIIISVLDGIMMSKKDEAFIQEREKIRINALMTGRSIGRNAMLIYLSRQNNKEKIKIDVEDLLDIEDSLEVDFLKNTLD